MIPPRSRCLVCCGDLAADDPDEYHGSCSRDLFGTSTPPTLDLGLGDIEEIARQEVNRRVTITGVQRKISLDLQPSGGAPDSCLTFVGSGGRFVLKPPTERFPGMPELEHATMLTAARLGIETATHGLVRLAGGELAYLARRFDRSDGEKLAMEDMCQLTGKLTEDKYRSSMEKVGRAILAHCANPVLDGGRLLEVALHAFVTGNADMHLKNFALLTEPDGRVRLSPAFDLVATRLLSLEDREETALSLNGKRARLERDDFVAFGRYLRVPDKAIERFLARVVDVVPDLLEVIDGCFLEHAVVTGFRDLVQERADRLVNH